MKKVDKRENQMVVKGEKAKARRKRATITRKEKEAIYRSMGLVKVRGSISGKIYWE